MYTYVCFVGELLFSED